MSQSKVNEKQMRLSRPQLPCDPIIAEAWRKDALQLVEAGTSLEDIDLIAAIFYASPHLHQIAKKITANHPRDMARTLSGETNQIIEEAFSSFRQELDTLQNAEQAMALLRYFRHRTYFTLALAELAGMIDVSEQSAYLSACADRALQCVLSLLCKTHKVPNEDLVILGMGKLGAIELNYSSDIDLIILYDGKKAESEPQKYVKLTRELVQIFQTQTGDGFAWRVDLRLRPDPGATAIALSLDAAISYYESIARSWERAVFIRARPVAGNLALGQTFLDAIKPFIWRRQLDYSILNDLKNWVTHMPLAGNGLGFDVKRGAFGIRHIEMMTHLLQLLHGGKDPLLQIGQTDKALFALEKAGHLSKSEARESAENYWHWRAIEHRLQYCRDAHIYHMPTNEQEFEEFALFAGMEGANDLFTYLSDLQARTKEAASHQIIKDMIAAHLGDVSAGSWPAELDRQISYLESFGFMRADEISRTIESWMSGRYAATRSERARDSLQILLPTLIKELSVGDKPDDFFMGFAQFLEALPSGVQILTLLNHQPQLIKLITNFSISAPSLMQELTKNPHIFEQMLDEHFFAPLDQHEPFEEAIERNITNKPVELQLDEVRRFVRDAKFRAATHILSYPDLASDAYAYLSQLADAALSASFSIARAEFEQKYGKIQKSNMAVILLGRAGQRKLTPQSDIDMIFVYDGDMDEWSDGNTSLSCGHYYQKLVTRLISWASAQTAAGMLYEIDTRLRPNGNAGPIAIHIDGWSKYIAENAWPFEVIALQKARIMPQPQASGDFVQRLEGILQKANAQKTSRTALRENIIMLREKLASQTATDWDFKKSVGGLLDCEFSYHLTGDMPALHNTLEHLNLISSVMMPRRHNIKTPPASFQAELCRIAGDSDFDLAKKWLDDQKMNISNKLLQELGL